MFDVEHALDIYADSYATFAAPLLYDERFLKQIGERADSFHIYLIGYVPKITQAKAVEENGELCITKLVNGKEFVLKWKIPEGWKFKQEGEDCFLESKTGQKGWINTLSQLKKLNTAVGGYPFTVKYIGQAFGNEGSRNALDRLQKHETLQKIAVKGIPDDTVLQVILLEIQAANRVITAFFPNAKNLDEDGTRRRQGLDKLFGTNEAERISLYEAALIRYFSPEFNKEFKNSFPSTNLKILQDCYNKDFLGLVSEICFDDFPFHLCSERVKPTLYHVIEHDLQNDAERKMFFSTDV